MMLGADCGVQPENQMTGFVAASRRGSLFVTPIVWTLVNEMGLTGQIRVAVLPEDIRVRKRGSRTHIGVGIKEAISAHESRPPAVPLEPARVMPVTPASASKVQFTNEKP